MTVRDRIEIALDRVITEIDATARDNGHDPHPWVFDSTNAAHTACRSCGHTAAVRVTMHDDEPSVWKAGHLRKSECRR